MYSSSIIFPLNCLNVFIWPIKKIGFTKTLYKEISKQKEIRKIKSIESLYQLLLPKVKRLRNKKFTGIGVLAIYYIIFEYLLLKSN